MNQIGAKRQQDDITKRQVPKGAKHCQTLFAEMAFRDFPRAKFSSNYNGSYSGSWRNFPNPYKLHRY